MPKKPRPETPLTRARVEQLYQDMTDAALVLGPIDLVDLRLVVRDWLRDRNEHGQKLPV